MHSSDQPQTQERVEVPYTTNGVYANGAARTQPMRSPIDATLPKSQAGLVVSEEAYWRVYYNHPDFNYEWNNGILEEKPLAKVRGSQQYQWFLLLLNAYRCENPRLHLVNLEIGFRMALEEKTTIRKPDLFVVLDDNPTPIDDDDRTYKGICDVCVESLSDSDQGEIDRDVITKRDEYAEAGVREYYILDCEGRYTTFYCSVRDPQSGKRTFALLPIGVDGVVRSAVMPGFQFRLRDLYRQPPLEDLVEDEVYRGYVWLAYQAQQRRAAQAEAEAAAERQRAEQERQRAEQERQRAEKAERLTAQERQHAEQERLQAEQERQRTREAAHRAEQERLRADAADTLARQYATQLRALGLLLAEESAP
ncbi:MAG: Uma2 family endonuclease [Caldilineaceae bacterium]